MERAYAPHARAHLFEALGIKERQDTDERSPLELTVDILNAEIELQQSQVLNLQHACPFSVWSVPLKAASKRENAEDSRTLNPAAQHLFFSSPGTAPHKTNAAGMRATVQNWRGGAKLQHDNLRF